MTLSSILSIAMVVLFGIALFGFLKLRKSPSNPKVRPYLQLFGVVCAVGSMVAIGASFYFSRDTTELFKLALPGCILLLLFVQMKGEKSHL